MNTMACRDFNEAESAAWFCADLSTAVAIPASEYEGLAVGALDHSGVLLVSSYLDCAE